jgi:hypothetical protein
LHFPIVTYTGHGHMLLTGFIHCYALPINDRNQSD